MFETSVLFAYLQMTSDVRNHVINKYIWKTIIRVFPSRSNYRNEDVRHLFLIFFFDECVMSCYLPIKFPAKRQMCV
jgi:hypothetical protein